jgi:hypothetical protein
MDTKFVVSQLITAIITIITTIIVVRVTLKGGFEVSQRLKTRFRGIANRYGRYTKLIIDLSLLVLMLIGLYRWCWVNWYQIPNRAEVFCISFLVFIGFFFLNQVLGDLFDSGILKDGPMFKRTPSP